jgi:hypothetical protein
VRFAVLLLATTVSAGACDVAATSAPRSVAFGDAFELKVGESVMIEDGALLIGFEDVSADSRCPKGEQCIREGDATVRIGVQGARGPKEVLDLHTSSREPATVSDPGCEVRLLRLEPYPVTGRTIPRGDYVATIEVTRGSSVPPDSR